MHFLEKIELHDLYDFESQTVINQLDDELDAEEMEEEEYGLDEEFEEDEDSLGLGDDDLDDGFALEEEGEEDEYDLDEGLEDEDEI